MNASNYSLRRPFSTPDPHKKSLDTGSSISHIALRLKIKNRKISEREAIISRMGGALNNADGLVDDHAGIPEVKLPDGSARKITGLPSTHHSPS